MKSDTTEPKRRKLIPGPQRIAVEVTKIDEKTAAGIILLDNDRESNAGIVHAVCPPYENDGQEYFPLYNVGDVVIFGKYTGTKLTVGRKQVIIMNEMDVLASLVEDDSGDIEDPSTQVTERA